LRLHVFHRPARCRLGRRARTAGDGGGVGARGCGYGVEAALQRAVGGRGAPARGNERRCTTGRAAVGRAFGDGVTPVRLKPVSSVVELSYFGFGSCSRPRAASSKTSARRSPDPRSFRIAWSTAISSSIAGPISSALVVA